MANPPSIPKKQKRPESPDFTGHPERLCCKVAAFRKKNPARTETLDSLGAEEAREKTAAMRSTARAATETFMLPEEQNQGGD